MMLDNQRPPEAEVRFHPQEYMDDVFNSTTTIFDDVVSFTVPIEDATTENNEMFVNDSYQSDVLKEHENAPEWVQEWEGPFFITIEQAR